jgi:hypothetical protein
LANPSGPPATTRPPIREARLHNPIRAPPAKKAAMMEALILSPTLKVVVAVIFVLVLVLVISVALMIVSLKENFIFIEPTLVSLLFTTT